MKKSLIYALTLLSLYGCGSYTLTNNKGYEGKSILAITEGGDTIAVPYRQFVKYRDTEFVRYRHNNNWYWNNWRYDFNWGWNQWWYSQPNRYWWNNDLRYTNPSRGYRAPSRPQVKPKTRPKRVRVNTPRGSRPNYTPRPPQRVQRNTTPSRTRTTPNVIQRNNVGRSSSGGSRGSSKGCAKC